MYIRCWGSRGSIPVSGKEYLKYGGDTTCLEVRSRDGRVIVIDAGTGIRLLGNKLVQEKASDIALLFTHAHWDHMMGFPFFVPIYLKGVRVTVRGYPFGHESFKSVISGLMEEPYFPVKLGDMDIKATLKFVNIGVRPFSIGSIRITPIFLSHPRNGGLGFRLEEDGKSFVFLTDNELGYRHDGGRSFEDYRKFCQGADLLIHDAEFTEQEYANILKISERPWGHSQFTDTVNLALAAEVRQLGLFHLNKDRTDRKVDAMVAQSRSIIRAHKSDCACFAVGSSFEITL
jgi:phosphoribosyl 1,2-cyclic phosphodiesterase